MMTTATRHILIFFYIYQIKENIRLRVIIMLINMTVFYFFLSLKFKHSALLKAVKQAIEKELRDSPCPAWHSG